ncbi:zinc finger CCCH domain-containing protein 14-like [Parasteatoda tepidariorum]|uniref:zinc finger CCCH domain-containing protein 14-like n=1 Tax=Parasteatoda tepidariorum TaxID=114398 RepID=UPI001C71A2D4|nr:zinc finger CCCH domain-containing protein 14-like [Parasteatoda tepidariorum]
MSLPKDNKILAAIKPLQQTKRKAVADNSSRSKSMKADPETEKIQQAPRCRFFPKCRMGQKCHFQHPTCKYNAACRNPKCIYRHIGPRKIELFDNKENVRPNSFQLLLEKLEKQKPNPYKWVKPKDDAVKNDVP